MVGPGTPSEFDSNGFLTPEALSTYQANGVLGAFACLDVGGVLTIDVAEPPSVTISVNGFPLATLATPGGSQQWVQVPVQYLKFAQRTPGQPQPTQAQCAANPSMCTQNLITVSGSVPVPFSVFQQIGGITIQAMHLLVLVHGIRADAAWFPTNGFEAPLDAMKIPYVFATAPTVLPPGLPLGTIAQTRALLQSIIPALAQQFGASKVHMVAHSKGGLWSRVFLKPGGPYSGDITLPPTPNNFGVLSLISLDSPFQGSILADIAVGAVNAANLLLSVTAVPRLAQTVLSIIDPSLYGQISDLTRAGVQANLPSYLPVQFEDTDGMVYPTVYESVAADADIGDKISYVGLRYVERRRLRRFFDGYAGYAGMQGFL